MHPGATRLYLVRHGQTDLSARRCYSGRRDIPLTDLGRQQAEHAGQVLRRARVDAVYSSPLSRAADTARAIAAATGAPVTIDQRLTEVDYGPLEGLERESARQQFGDAFDTWRQEPMRCPIPGVESLATALERVTEATGEVLANSGCPVIVAHQGILRVVLMALGELNAADYFKVLFSEAEPLKIDSPVVAPLAHSQPVVPRSTGRWAT